MCFVSSSYNENRNILVPLLELAVISMTNTYGDNTPILLRDKIMLNICETKLWEKSCSECNGNGIAVECFCSQIWDY